MAITYKDSRRSQSNRTGLGPLLALIAAIGGLLVLSPQVTGVLASTVTSVLRLPVY